MSIYEDATNLLGEAEAARGRWSHADATKADTTFIVAAAACGERIADGLLRLLQACEALRIHEVTADADIGAVGTHPDAVWEPRISIAALKNVAALVAELKGEGP